MRKWLLTTVGILFVGFIVLFVLTKPLGQRGSETTTEFRTKQPRAPAPRDDTAELSEIAKQAGRTEYLPVSFATLSGFKYETTDDELKPKRADQIPVEVKLLSGKKVAAWGFVFPLLIEKQKISSFLIMGREYNGHGAAVPMNELVLVRYDAKLDLTNINALVVVYGTLEVGEEYEKGELISIYRIQADHVQTVIKEKLTR